MAITRKPERYLHLQYSCRISHLSSIPDSQSVVGDLQVELLKVDLDHLKYRPTKKKVLPVTTQTGWMDGWRDGKTATAIKARPRCEKTRLMRTDMNNSNRIHTVDPN